LKNPWPNCAQLSRHAAAVLGALHLDEPELPRLTELEWASALDYADRERVTLALRDACGANLPAAIRERVDQDLAKNRVRRRGIADTCRDLEAWFSAESLEFIFLKGVTHAETFGLPPDNRVQYDIDLWLPREDAGRAQQLLVSRGYASMPGTEDLPTDHLPALVRQTGWQWRGDFFDPEIPLPVELHVQFWNSQQERFSAPGTEEFPGRCVGHALHPADAVAYAALHVLRHVLTGSVRIFHVYEIAAMLHARADDALFWDEWRRLHPAGLRRLEALSFRLAREWFGGTAASIVTAELDHLPAAGRAWFDSFALSPATLTFRPNKDHLWLHLTLLDSGRGALQVAAQRILPRSLPAAAGDAFVPDEELTWRDWLRWRLHWVAHTAHRAAHHLRALPSVATSGARWWWLTRRQR